MTDADNWTIPGVADLEVIRQRKSLSCRELSRQAGLSEGHWARIVNEDYDPHLSTVRAVAAVLVDSDHGGVVPAGRPPAVTADERPTDTTDRDPQEPRR